MFKTAIAGTALALIASAASATVVTFDDFTPIDTVLTTFTDGGLTFTAGSGLMDVWDGSSPNSNGTNNLILGFTSSDVVTITKTGGGAFDLNSFQMAISWYDPNATDTVNVNGNPLGIDTTLTTYTFNVTSTADTISGLYSGTGYWTLDNLTYNAVPEPASWALMLAGFGGLGMTLRSRRRTAAAL